MGRVIHFLSNEAEQQLNSLRKQLERNTSEILTLFRERADIARDIGQFKVSNSMPLRIREREHELLNSMAGMDPVSRSIISSLFEFTIANEEKKGQNIKGQNEETIELHGQIQHLGLLAGLMISAPGVEVYSRAPLPPYLMMGIQANGAHLILEEFDEPDVVVGIDLNEQCGLVLDSRGVLRARLDCLMPPRALRVLVKQA